MPALSIIVPIYNVEKYLSKCLDSILAQSFSDFELILINDGSQDHSNLIMEEYAQKDKRIITVYKENQGVSAARNTGLELAHGKYIGFVDADDWISSNMYNDIISDMEEHSADLGIVGLKYTKDYNASITQTIITDKAILKQEQLAAELFHIPHTISSSVCNKLFRKDHIKQFFDPSLRMAEDLMFVLNYLENVSMGVWIKTPLYYVRTRAESATRSDPDIYIDSLKIKKQICETLKTSVFFSVYDIAFNDYFDTCIRAMYLQPKGSVKRKMVKSMVESELAEMMGNNYITFRRKILFFYKYLTCT